MKPDKIIHGIALASTIFPPRDTNVTDQLTGNVRGNTFLFRLVLTNTSAMWEAYLWNEHELRYDIKECARDLSAVVQLSIKHVELWSMRRLEPEDRSWIDEETDRVRMFE